MLATGSSEKWQASQHACTKRPGSLSDRRQYRLDVHHGRHLPCLRSGGLWLCDSLGPDLQTATERGRRRRSEQPASSESNRALPPLASTDNRRTVYGEGNSHSRCADGRLSLMRYAAGTLGLPGRVRGRHHASREDGLPHSIRAACAGRQLQRSSPLDRLSLPSVHDCLVVDTRA